VRERLIIQRAEVQGFPVDLEQR